MSCRPPLNTSHCHTSRGGIRATLWLFARFLRLHHTTAHTPWGLGLPSATCTCPKQHEALVTPGVAVGAVHKWQHPRHYSSSRGMVSFATPPLRRFPA